MGKYFIIHGSFGSIFENWICRYSCNRASFNDSLIGVQAAKKCRNRSSGYV